MKLYIWCSATSNFEHPRYLFFFVRNLKLGACSTPNRLFVKSILVPYDLFIKIKKRYFRGSSIICSWKFRPLLMTVLANILSRGAFEKQISWFLWKVLKQLWIFCQVLVLFSRDTLGVLKCSTIVSGHNLFLIPFFNCVLSDRVKFWVINVCFCDQFKLVFWCVSLFICVVVKPAKRIWNYTYGVQLPQILCSQGICFFVRNLKFGSVLNT